MKRFTVIYILAICVLSMFVTPNYAFSERENNLRYEDYRVFDEEYYVPDREYNVSKSEYILLNFEQIVRRREDIIIELEQMIYEREQIVYHRRRIIRDQERTIREAYHIKAINQKFEYKHLGRKFRYQGENDIIRTRYRQKIRRRWESTNRRYNPRPSNFYNNYYGR